jgi:hypothetical protein
MFLKEPSLVAFLNFASQMIFRIVEVGEGQHGGLGSRRVDVKAAQVAAPELGSEGINTGCGWPVC